MRTRTHLHLNVQVLTTYQLYRSPSDGTIESNQGTVKNDHIWTSAKQLEPYGSGSKLGDAGGHLNMHRFHRFLQGMSTYQGVVEKVLTHSHII